MVFTFEDKEDLARVLNSSPWNIKGTPLFLKKWKNDETFKEVDFSKVAIWVQVHGLPLNHMNTANATIIAESLGGLVQANNFENMKPSRKSFLCIRVLLPLNDPLPTGFLLQRASKPPAEITYQFKRLSDFCYAYGRLGHISTYCPLDPRPFITGRYGPKLKASAPYVNRVELLHSSRKLAVPMAAIVVTTASSSRAQPNLPAVSTQYAEASGSLQLSTAQVSSHSLSQQVSPTIPPVLSPDHFPTAALMEKSPTVKIQMSLITSHLMFSQLTTLNNLQLNLPNSSWPQNPNSNNLTYHPNATLTNSLSPNQSSSPPTRNFIEDPLSSPTATLPTSLNIFPKDTSYSLSKISSHPSLHKPPKYPHSATPRKWFHPYSKLKNDSLPNTYLGPCFSKKPKLLSAPQTSTSEDEVSNATDVFNSSGVASFTLPPSPQ